MRSTSANYQPRLTIEPFSATEKKTCSWAPATHIATLVKRHSRFVMLVKLDGKTTDVDTAALAAKIREFPDQLKRSLTWDRGLEVAAHKTFTIDTGVKVYFCDPRALAVRHEREHQRPAAPVLPARHQPAALFASRPQQRRSPAQRPDMQDLGFMPPARLLSEALR